MKTKKANSNYRAFFGTVGYCLKLSWYSSHLYTSLRLVGRMLSPVCGIVSAYFGKYMLDLLAGSWAVNHRVSALLWLAFGMLVIALANAGIQKAVQYAQGMHNEILEKEIQMHMMEKSIHADLEMFDNPAYYDKLTSATRDSYALTSILWNVLDCVSSCITFIGVFAILAPVNIFYGLGMLLAAFPSAIASQKYTKLLYRLSLSQTKGERQKGYLYHLSTYKPYAQDIRLFDLGGRLQDRYLRLWNELFCERQGMTRKRSVLTGLLDCLPEMAIIGVTLDISFRVLNGAATVGDYSLYTGLMGQLWSSIYVLTNSAMKIYEDRLKIANVQSLEQFHNRVADTGTRKIQRVEQIEFQSVSFSYPNTKCKTLNRVSFTVSPGERVALVGVNGSGKSTLIKLLLRFYDADDGAIRINGHPIQEYPIRELRRCFSVYFQEMLNYGFTLKENITLSDFERNDEKAIGQAFIESCAEDVLERASDDLDTYLTRQFEDSGIELSGGQNQKVALARTLYRRSSALILDEPSSSLDPEAENRVFKTLERLSRGKTTLFTSHRLSNVMLADRIVVLEQGRVIEQGTQKELLNTESRYAELYHYQAEKYQAGKQEVVC